MKATLIRVLTGIVTAVALAMPMAGYPQAPAPFTPPQLDQILAPIALYPDPLLGQILMAATYPLEVVEAARWLQDPGNASLKGDQLAVAMQSEGWDPSVKSLVPFPQILQMMNSQLGWMQQLGDAFLAQQAEVMDSVQKLRTKARTAGTLYSTPEALVSSDGTMTTIEPAEPQLIYPPSYEPTTVYGDWPYPDYPPYNFSFYPGYGPLVGDGISYVLAISVVLPLWGWDECDWRHHRIRIDDDRYNAINRDRRPRAASSMWEHDPFHRRGVAYRDEQSRQRFLGKPGGSPETRRAYRGYEGASPVAPPMVRPELTTPRLPSVSEQRRDLGRDRSPASPPLPALPAPAPARVARPSVQPNPPRPSATFGEIDGGRDIQRQVERGRASRESLAPPAPRQVEPPHGAPAGRAGRRDR